MTATLQMAKRGLVTIPKTLREQYGLHEGDSITLIDLGGTFLLHPGRSELNALADQISGKMKKSGMSLDSMLSVLREERETYGRRRTPVR